MLQLRNLSGIVVAVAALLAPTERAAAEDALKVTVAHRGGWETAAPHLGQEAGIFRKHGIVLDLSYAQADQDAELPVISGTAEVGVGVGVIDALRAYADKDAALRIIGASMTGSANYWYVEAASPIKNVKDVNRRTIAYWKGGSSGQYDVFDFMDRYRLKARPALTSGEAAAFDQVMAGKIDVGWATPPFGLDALEQNRIRVVAKANDIPKIRDKTVGVMIASTSTLEKRGDVLGRFAQAYRETVDWMYSDPAAPKAYANFADMPEPIARLLRDEFFTKEMLSPDKVLGLSVIAKDAVKARSMRTSMSRRQLREIVQIPSSDRAKASARGGGLFRLLSPRSP
jgi:NitT/TauT family transport system substrate-binding protein